MDYNLLNFLLKIKGKFIKDKIRVFLDMVNINVIMANAYIAKESCLLCN